MDTITAIKHRVSARTFIPGKKLSKAQILELITCASHAPSAYNLQHARFLAVTDIQAKDSLKAVANGQQKVVDASVVFIVLADLNAHRKHEVVAKQGVTAGVYDMKVAGHIIQAATTDYTDNKQFTRDEAIRSASLAAMNLMTAATAMGLSSCPMAWFSREKLKQQFKIDDDYLPIMLIAVGMTDNVQKKKPRLLPEQILVIDARVDTSYTLR